MLAFVAGCVLSSTIALAPPAHEQGKQADSAAASEMQTIAGKVVTLAEALKARGVVADSDTLANQVVVVAADGTIIPLLCDEASRALFKDDRLRNRRSELVVKRLAGLPHVQVLTFQVEEEGKLRTPEYYCEVCSISVRAPQVCICCQGPMELRFKTDTP